LRGDLEEALKRLLKRIKKKLKKSLEKRKKPGNFSWALRYARIRSASG
jgi:flagellar motility protein MotE (MotC chaperone)